MIRIYHYSIVEILVGQSPPYFSIGAYFRSGLTGTPPP